MQGELSDRTVMQPKRKFGVNDGKYIKGAASKNGIQLGRARGPSLHFCVAISLLQIFTQLHSFEYGTRLMRYPDFTPVTT
jgi:hypothetical protein